VLGRWWCVEGAGRSVHKFLKRGKRVGGGACVCVCVCVQVQVQVQVCLSFRRLLSVPALPFAPLLRSFIDFTEEVAEYMSVCLFFKLCTPIDSPDQTRMLLSGCYLQPLFVNSNVCPSSALINSEQRAYEGDDAILWGGCCLCMLRKRLETSTGQFCV